MSKRNVIIVPYHGNKNRVNALHNSHPSYRQQGSQAGYCQERTTAHRIAGYCQIIKMVQAWTSRFEHRTLQIKDRTTALHHQPLKEANKKTQTGAQILVHKCFRSVATRRALCFTMQGIATKRGRMMMSTPTPMGGISSSSYQGVHRKDQSDGYKNTINNNEPDTEINNNEPYSSNTYIKYLYVRYCYISLTFLLGL